MSENNNKGTPEELSNEELNELASDLFNMWTVVILLYGAMSIFGFGAPILWSVTFIALFIGVNIKMAKQWDVELNIDNFISVAKINVDLYCRGLKLTLTSSRTLK